MVSKFVLLFAVLSVVAGSPITSWAGNGREPQHGKTPAASSGSAIDQYLREELGVEDPTLFNQTLKFKSEVTGSTVNLEADPGQLSPEAKERALKLLAPKSMKTLVELIKVLALTDYSNPVVLGPAGVGKSFLLNQLAAVLSYGVIPDYLAEALGLPKDGSPLPEGHPYKNIFDRIIGKTDLVIIDSKLLSIDNTQEGKAFAKAEMRTQTLLTDLMRLPKVEFAKSGRRTLFICDEVAGLPDYIQQALKKPLDASGFHNPNDPVAAASDAGFGLLPMTTPEEWEAIVEQGDNAVKRRYTRINIEEPTEVEALEILINRAANEWESHYGVTVDIEALEYIISMRKVFSNTTLAMPGSVLKPVNQLFVSKFGEMKNFVFDKTKKLSLTLQDAQEFVVKVAGLTSIWLPGPNGEPPFHDLAAQLKARVIGQDAIMDQIARIVREAATNGFPDGLPTFIFMGPPGSGKDTTAIALNEILFGTERPDLNYSLAGGSPSVMENILEVGAKETLPLLADALNKNAHGVIVLNETKDLASHLFEKLKVLTETGVLQGRGIDKRVFLLNFNLLIMNGQYGEELVAGKTEAEIDNIVASLTQGQLEQILMDGKFGKDGSVGNVPAALIDRIKRTGGFFFFKPVKKQYFPEIVKLYLKKAVKALFRANRTEMIVDTTLIEYIAKTAAHEGEGPRGLSGIATDFTRIAISEAKLQGLPQRNFTARVRYEQENGVDLIVVEQLKGTEVLKSYRLDANSLRRTKSSTCEKVLTEPTLR